MASSDDEVEAVPSTVSNYDFVDDKDEPVSFSELTFHWNGTERLDGNKKHVFLRGAADNGLQKIYKQVTAWKFDSLRKEPEISVLTKEDNWIKLEKPRKAFQDTIRTILITVHCLHFVKKNPESSGKPLWDHLSKVFSLYEPRPSENDLVDHMDFINEYVKRDERLAKSKVLVTLLEEKPSKRKIFDEVESEMSKFIVDDIEDDDVEDTYKRNYDDVEDSNKNKDGDVENESDDEDNNFESVCALCDNGGELLCCDGKCLRSFHATVEDGSDSMCESLRFTKEQVETMANQDFYCKNCECQQHQCYACGELGSSDQSSLAEVFRCVNATCGRFYHPYCVSRLIHPEASKADELRKKIAGGEPFACPMHQCSICKQIEDKNNNDLQFAICRRCPTSYHRKCLPKGIAFSKNEDEEDEDEDVVPRAWEDLIPNRILIYCLKHEIDEELETPLRDHIRFPGDHRRGKQTSERLAKPKVISADDTNGKRVVAKKLKNVEKSTAMKFFDSSRKRDRGLSLPESSKKQKVADATRKSFNKVSSAKLYKANATEGRVSLGHQLYAFMGRESQPVDSNEEGKVMKSDKKETSSSGTLDAAAKNRLISMMRDVTSSITLEKIIEKHKVPTSHLYSSKFDKSITLGKVEGSIEAIRAALHRLDEGGTVEDAKAVCEPGLLTQIMKWRNKLKVYLAPFLYGMRYTSFGRHFTKVEKLREIVDMLRWYVRDGDMIVDFCCGSNDFSCLLKRKLDEMGKKCSYKNYDILNAKNNFSFEKRDWMTVQSKELPPGSKLIMGLNPPFGVNAALANKFINKALEFKPKLLVLIVPRETERLDAKKSPYDLIWEDDVLLGGKSFYLPGSVDLNDKQLEDWNVVTPPLYLWSRPDWTTKHKAIAQMHGHPSKSDNLEGSRSHTPVPRPALEHGDLHVEPARIQDDLLFQDNKRLQHKEHRERLHSNCSKEAGETNGHGKNKSDEKSAQGSKNKGKRIRELDEKSTQDNSIGKRSLSRNSSPSLTNLKTVDRYEISPCKEAEKEGNGHFAGKSTSAVQTEPRIREAEKETHGHFAGKSGSALKTEPQVQEAEEEGYRHFAGHSASALTTEPWTQEAEKEGYLHFAGQSASALTEPWIHEAEKEHYQHIAGKRSTSASETEPWIQEAEKESYRHFAGQSASALQTEQRTGYGAFRESDIARRYSLPIQEPYSSATHQYPKPASPAPDYGFRATDEQFMSYQRESADVPSSRPYTSHLNGGLYANESDARVQGNFYGQQGNDYLNSRIPSASTGYSSYGQVSPAVGPTYGRTNISPMQRYSPHLVEELNRGRMNSMGSSPSLAGTSGVYDAGAARPAFQGNTLGFAPRPYHPFSQQNSSGWLNE